MDAMSNVPLYQDEAEQVQETAFDRDAIEQELIKIVNDDFKAAQRFMSDVHGEMLVIDQQYRNSGRYNDLKKEDLFPVPLMQELTDQFVAEAADKLLYTGRPCDIVPLDDTQQADADTKQEMMDFQDHQDAISEKMLVFLRDAALFRIAVAAVNYCHRTVTILTEVPDGEPIPQVSIDPVTGEQVVTTTQPMKVVPVEKTVFEGAETVRIAPWDLFVTKDNKDANSKAPVIVRSFHDWFHFFGKDYFQNTEKLHDLIDANKSGMDENEDNRQNHQTLLTGNGAKDESTSAKLKYIEWHGFVPKATLFKYLGYETDVPIEPWERCRAILGVVGGRVLVRAQSNPYQYGRPSIVIGTLEREGESIIGNSPASKILACCKGTDTVTGMYIANMKQVVNAGWAMDEMKLIRKDGTKVNNPGGIVYTQGNPADAVMRIEAGSVAPDLAVMQGAMRQWAKDAYGLQDVGLGKGDEGAETLGENQLLAASGSLRMRNYIKTFETTFVEPLYTLRNHIDALTINQEYVFSVIGEKGLEWKTIDPDTIRAGVKFTCQASQRETQRAVIMQQMLQLIQVSPTVTQMGLPFRIDKLVKELCSSGFSMTERKVFELLPHLKLEAEGGLDIDTMMIQRFLLQFAVGNAQAVMGVEAGQQQLAAGEQVPEGSSQESVTSANQERNTTQTGRINP